MIPYPQGISRVSQEKKKKKKWVARLFEKQNARHFVLFLEMPCEFFLMLCNVTCKID